MILRGLPWISYSRSKRQIKGYGSTSFELLLQRMVSRSSLLFIEPPDFVSSYPSLMNLSDLVSTTSSRSSIPVPRDSSPRATQSPLRMAISLCKSPESISPTKRSSLSDRSMSLQNCYQLVTSFLTSYYPRLSLIFSKYPYVDYFITVLYASVELYRLSGQMASIIKSKHHQFSISLEAEQSNLNLEALSLLRLVKDTLSTALIDASQASLFKSHMVALVTKSHSLVFLISSQLIQSIKPPNPPLDPRIISNFSSEWAFVNRSLSDSLGKLGNLPPKKLHRYSSSHSLAYSNVPSVPSEPISFKRMQSILLEISDRHSDNLLPAAKLALLKALQRSQIRDATMLESILEFLFECRSMKNSILGESCSQLASEARIFSRLLNHLLIV
jgi:hypothetical protein